MNRSNDRLRLKALLTPVAPAPHEPLAVALVSVGLGIPRGDGSAVVLSVARYYTPKGKAVQDGITPSVEAVQYAGALPDQDYPPEGSAGNQPDLQIQKAVDLLHNAHAATH